MLRAEPRRELELEMELKGLNLWGGMVGNREIMGRLKSTCYIEVSLIRQDMPVGIKRNIRKTLNTFSAQFVFYATVPTVNRALITG